MAVEVRTEQAAPRRLAAVRSVTTPHDLGRTIGRSLGIVWPAVREQGVRFGHNVFVYREGEPGTLIVELGVEVFGERQAAARRGELGGLRRSGRGPGADQDRHLLPAGAGAPRLKSPYVRKDQNPYPERTVTLPAAPAATRGA